MFFVLFGLVLLMALPVLGAEACFTDVSADKWYYEEVKKAYQQGLMEGVSTTSFAPEQSLTQSMVVTVLGRLGDADSAQETTYSAWARGIRKGTDIPRSLLSADAPVTREQMAVFLCYYVEKNNIEVPTVVAPTFADGSTVSAWAKDAVDQVRRWGLMTRDDAGYFNPQAEMTRAEGATVFVRLNEILCEGHTPTLRLWQTDTGLEVDGDRILSSSALAAAVKTYGISKDSDAYQALKSINSRYSDELTDRSQPLLFFFEGVGSDSDPELRMNAMCVLIQNGKITYLNMNSTTIPDYPFEPSLNDGVAVPTLVSGIYDFDTVNHKSRYAALRVLSDSVVRFESTEKFYLATSGGIHIHRRYKNAPAPLSAGWANSVGCLMVGRAGTKATDEYATFLQTLGVISEGTGGTAKYQTQVTGKLIVDRTYAGDYLSAVGYSDEAIALLG
jgi:hypothetical protein